MTMKPTVHYWHLWTDGEGTSHQTRCPIHHFELKSIQPDAAPQWLGKTTTGEMTAMVIVLPIGWIGNWHENPKPQWIIPLSGCWFVEAMDGTRVELGAGDISFGGDQNCCEVDGKKGHKSGTVGGAPAVLMIVQFDTIPAPACPCEFR
jgi:hypothetical protein